MKIFVAIPVYDGKLQVQTVKCLLEETTVANGFGDELRVNFLPSCAVPAHGRNQLIELFLESDCDKLFFLDADITFLPGSIIKICHYPEDIVGGCYRFKCEDEKYPADFIPGPLQADQHGLLEVSMLPTGFLSISREAFEKFRTSYPGREYDHWGKSAFAYFQMFFKNGALYSDDSGFCKEWREAGHKIYLDPEITLVHWDSYPTPFPGHIGNWLKRINGIPLTTTEGTDDQAAGADHGGFAPGHGSQGGDNVEPLAI